MENDTWQKMHYFFWLAWFSKKVIIHKSRGVLFVKRYFDKNESALIWKETEDKSVQLVRGNCFTLVTFYKIHILVELKLA